MSVKLFLILYVLILDTLETFTNVSTYFWVNITFGGIGIAQISSPHPSVTHSISMLVLSVPSSYLSTDQACAGFSCLQSPLEEYCSYGKHPKSGSVLISASRRNLHPT